MKIVSRSAVSMAFFDLLSLLFGDAEGSCCGALGLVLCGGNDAAEVDDAVVGAGRAVDLATLAFLDIR